MKILTATVYVALGLLSALLDLVLSPVGILAGIALAVALLR